MSIGAPSCLAAASGGQLPRRTSCGEGGDRQVSYAVLIEAVGQPFSVGRELVANLVARRRNYVMHFRQRVQCHPRNIVAGLRPLHHEDHVALRRYIHGASVVGRFHNAKIFGGSASETVLL